MNQRTEDMATLTEALNYISDEEIEQRAREALFRLATLESPPKGWRFVPDFQGDETEAQLSMLIAGKKSLYSCCEDPEIEDARKCFKAMISAAPLFHENALG
jgi:hypothetical protein